MGKTILVFLFSNRADSYINAIAHAFDRMQVDAFKLVHVKGAKTSLNDSEANAVYNKVLNRLQELSNVADIYKRMDERLGDRHLKPVTYSNLKDDLNKLLKQHGGNDSCVIDLTGATKAASIDIFSVCLALDIRSVYVFELEDKPDPSNPQASLYHALGQNGYSYSCLADSGPVRSSRSALLRKSSILWIAGITALIVMAGSLILLTTGGPNSLFLQVINVAAAVVGLTSPLFALLEQRRR